MCNYIYLFIIKQKVNFVMHLQFENAKNAAYASYKLKRDFNDT